MATNSLTRTSGNVNGQFVYRHTQIADQNNSVYGQDGSIWTLFYGNSSRSGYNNPFVSSAEWRMLNLRLTKSPYNGKLEFGFSNNSSNPLSAICGFTVGIPPLYATHINTIARSVAYGFIRNPMADDGSLWIVHENTINQVSGTYGIDNLSITAEGNQVTYKTGNTELSKRTITYTDAHLYVVGACGYAGNSIVNVGLENGSGFNASLPDWDNKEIWILCNGLTNNPQNYYNTPHETTNPIAASTLTRLDVKLQQQNASFTMEFPDESTTAITQSDNNYKTTPNNKTINAQVPIVVKLKFNNFTEIKGLKIICQMTGTETSLTRFRTDNTTLRTNLNNLEELQLRSSASSTQSRFAPGIGIAPLPLQNLKSLVIEGSFDVNSIVNNLHKCVNLEELYSDLSLSLYAFKISAMRKLRYLYFSKFAGLGTTGITFSGFRELFNPSRTSNITHGLYYTYPSGGENSLVPEYAELATAQVSAIKLYGWSHTKLGFNNTATPNYTTFIGMLNFGFNFNGGTKPLKWTNYSYQSGSDKINSELSFANAGTQCTIRLKEIIQTDISGWTQFFPEDMFICFKKQDRNNTPTPSEWTGISTNHQLRRVGNTSYTWDTATGNLNITFNLKPIKNQSSISGLNITTDNAYSAGITGVSYFTLSANSAVFNNISIGDTVRVNNVNLPLSNATPSIVVDKSSNNQTVTVLKGSVNNDIIDGNNQTAIFNYEFPLATTEAITDTLTYTNDIDKTVIVTWVPAGVYTNMAAAFAYMFEGVAGGY
jgi:hypothetical protein